MTKQILSQFEIEGGIGETSISITPDINIKLKTIENDIFNSSDIQVKVDFYKKKNITVNNSKDESSTNYHTLSDAIDAVAEYGIITIESDLSGETIILNKSINLISKSLNKLTNYQIINQAKEVLIQGIHFTNNDNSVTNNGEILIKECKFDNHEGNSAIITNNNIMIYKCEFENNKGIDGSCIYIQNKNSKTIIDQCSFKQNYASGYGSCIYSNKGNDVEIVRCEFTNQNESKVNGTCISVYGNTYISQNTFYDNIGNNEIFLTNGTIEMERNIFDGEITSVAKYNGEIIDEGLNYWGYNDMEVIEDINGIELTTYLISRCKTVRKDDTNFYAIGLIDQYKNRLEKDIITNIEPIQSSLPVRIGNIFSSLNKEEIIIKNNSIMYIGKAEVEANVDGN